MEVAVILLTWGRPQRFEKTLKMLDAQTNKNFELHVSSGNDKIHKFCETTANNFKTDIKIHLHNNGNKYSCFRRFFLAKNLAEQGVDVIINIDDDVEFGPESIEESLNQYEPRTIKAKTVWHLQDGSDYFKNRTKITSKNFDQLKADYAVGQCGMFDSSFFLQPELYAVPPLAYECDDLWASYVADELLGWEIKPLELSEYKDTGGDKAALYKNLQKRSEKGSKQLLLEDLMEKGWLSGRE